jgi:hypothetical protein
MRIIHYLSWIFFFVILTFNIYKYVDLNYVERIPCKFVQLQFVNSLEGKDLLNKWCVTATHHDTTLLQEAVLNTQWDFLFILSYVSLLIIVSYNQMQRERSPSLNNLLRLNFPLAIITGLLDTTENCILLDDMKPYHIGTSYHSSYWVSLPKFILAAWILLVWLVSLIKSKTRPSPPYWN